MFAVIFEVQPKPERYEEYLELAKHLKPRLERIDGFIDNERFASRRTEGRILSLSTWRDEKSVIRWRTLGSHHEVQEKGRFEIFADYHLRVGEIVGDSEARAPLPEQRLDETEIGVAKAMTISELASGPELDLAAALALPTGAALDHEIFESIYNEGKLLLLAAWRDAASAAAWQPRPQAERKLRHRRIRIVRDYGMGDRREAPQFYPAVDPHRG
jgi:heme-degrading monooxygenase HmoA